MTTSRKLAEVAALLIGLGVITGSTAVSGRVTNERTQATQASHSYYDLVRSCPLSFTLPADQADLARVRAREFQAAYGEALKVQVIETRDRDGVRFSVDLTTGTCSIQ